MKWLYTDQYRQAVRSQLSRRLVPLCVVSGVLLAVVIWSFVARQQVFTVASVIVLGVVLIFSLDVLCKPLRQYDRFLASALTGRNHTDEFIFDHPESEISMVDGVSYRSLVFLGEPDKHGTREQMFYWDSQLPLPDFTPGQALRICYTGKMIIGYEAV